MLIFQILFIFHIIKQQNCLNNLEDNIIPNTNRDYNNLKITPGIIETKYLYKRASPFTFFFSNETNYTYDLLINFYSINCIIDININNKSNMNDIGKVLPNLIGHDKDTFSLRINKNEIKNTLINIEPLNNDFYYNYNYNRTCPLVINSIIIDKSFNLNINGKEPIYLYFNESFNNLILTYELKNFTQNSYVALLFSYQENAYFEVTVSDENKNKLKWKALNISNSNNIFLTKELQNIKKLFINITYHIKNLNSNKSQDLLKLEIKTDKSPPIILEKNYINKELITSNLEYKHLYYEVFKGEGGEIILHDKRQSGILIGSIIQKESIKDSISNPDIYPKFNSKNQGNPLNYDKYSLKLYFNFNDTKECDKGCYILISYYNEKFATKNNVIIGFEFTLLLRIWDDREFQSQIINIPLNEYAFGFFEDKSVKEHYYSIYISDEIDGISMQIQGENIKGFYGYDKRKINENLIWYNVYDLNISNYKNIIYINTKNFKNNYISFLMKPNGDSFSYYYFRILLNKTNEMILPLDSNMGNNCISANNHCYFLLKNDYNIFSLNLTIFISNPINYFSVYTMNIDNIYTFDFNYYIDCAIHYDYSDFNDSENHYINFENDNNIDYVFLIIYINQIITNNILSAFYDVKKEINPNIYSSKLYILDNYDKYAHLSLKDNFKVKFCSFYGQGIVNWGDYFKNQLFSQNMIGQYYKIPVKDNITDITFKDEGDFIFYIKIINLEVNKRFHLGENLNDFIKNENFPLYYILNIEKRDNEDIDINFKIINLNDNITEKDTKFELEGAITNRYEYEKIKNKGKQLEHSIKGEYDVCTKLGFLSFPIKNNNKKKIIDDEENNIVLIKISGIKEYSNINTFIQILATKRTLEIIVPINQYIIQNYDSNISPSFTIDIIKKNDITLEFHRNSKVVEIKNLNDIYDEKDEIVIYSIKDTDEYDISVNFGILLKNISKTYEKYMLKYNYEQEEKEEYEFKPYKKKIERIYNSILFEFDNIKILGNNNINDNNITFIVYSYIYLNDDFNETLFNILNSLIPNSIQPFSESKVIVDSKDKNFKIIFNDILKDKEEHHFIIQIKVFINKNNDYFYNKYLFYTFKEKLKKEININYIAVIFIIMIFIIIVIVVLIFVIYYKMKRKNLNLQAILDTSFKENENKKEEEEEVKYSYI